MAVTAPSDTGERTATLTVDCHIGAITAPSGWQVRLRRPSKLLMFNNFFLVDPVARVLI